MLIAIWEMVVGSHGTLRACPGIFWGVMLSNLMPEPRDFLALPRNEKGLP